MRRNTFLKLVSVPMVYATVTILSSRIPTGIKRRNPILMSGVILISYGVTAILREKIADLSEELCGGDVWLN